MRRLMTMVCVGVAASCATPVEEKQLSVPVTHRFPEIIIVADDNTQHERTKKAPQPRKQQVSMVISRCSDIATGDLRRDINMKLECITEQVRYR